MGGWVGGTAIHVTKWLPLCNLYNTYVHACLS